MIAAAAGAFYLVLPQLAQVSDSWRAFQSIDWVWVPVIVAMSFLTYVASAVSMVGAVPHAPAVRPDAARPSGRPRSSTGCPRPTSAGWR